MFKEYILLFLLIHILGDYYLQNDTLAKQKEESLHGLFKHGVIYLCVCMAIVLLAFSAELVIAGIMMAFSHGVIDYIKYRYTLYLKKKSKMANVLYMPKVYVADQCMHFIFIFAIAYVLTINGCDFHALFPVEEFFRVIDISFVPALKWIIILLMIWKPANITIKCLLSFYRPNDHKDDNKKAGGLIGLLERLIILIFLSTNQYSAIGLVLTAKSIARYEKISSDKEFAEYYLLGTLMSTLIVIVLHLWIM